MQWRGGEPEVSFGDRLVSGEVRWGVHEAPEMCPNTGDIRVVGQDIFSLPQIQREDADMEGATLHDSQRQNWTRAKICQP